MPANAAPPPPIDPAILMEAADWLVLLQSGEASEQHRAELARWRERSPAHAAAWERAQGMIGSLQQVPPQLAHDTLLRPGRGTRRHVLRIALLALPTGVLAWHFMPWREWRADLATGVGEQKTVTLADGTRLVLNTRSAVNVAFTAAERLLTLVAGEILVTTSARDPSPLPNQSARPFVVDTPHGRLRALGTRFSVRRTEDDTRLAVFEGAVEIRPAGGAPAAIVRAGQQAAFSAAGVQPAQPVQTGAASWEHGLLVARDMRLDELAAELARYHRGVLRCDPAVAGLTVSGAFPVTDTLASLDMVAKTLPVRIGGATPYWLTIQPR